jgi:DNA-binding transcriptional MerR regulator
MQEQAESRRRWRVGELAAATGLTVRALHHYEHVGLLSPRSRTEGRQRLYDEHDLRRLYRICAMRDLGMSLADIRRTFDGDRTALGDVLRAHRARVDAEIKRLRRLRRLLDHACAHSGRDVGADVLLATIEAMWRVSTRGVARGAGARRRARWKKLGLELRACMSAGEAPSSPRARSVARVAKQALVEFAGGDHAHSVVVGDPSGVESFVASSIPSGGHL